MSLIDQANGILGGVQNAFGVRLPSVRIPNLGIPSISVPGFGLNGPGLPTVNLPGINIPGILGSLPGLALTGMSLKTVGTLGANIATQGLKNLATNVIGNIGQGVLGTKAFDPFGLSQITIKPLRKLGPFTADAVIEEEHSDEMVLTHHPVEQGATITDHAYKNPAQIVLTYAWSASSSQGNGNPNFLRNVYANLLQMQVNRALFDVLTGKRVYRNMILRSLATTTNGQTENSLVIRAVCEEVLFATTRVIQIGQASAANMADPEKTAPTINEGIKNLEAATAFNLPDLANFVPSPGSIMSTVRGALGPFVDGAFANPGALLTGARALLTP